MSYMIEGGGSRTLSKAKAWLYRHPEESVNFLNGLTEVVVNYLVEQVLRGAQVNLNSISLELFLGIW